MDSNKDVASEAKKPTLSAVPVKSRKKLKVKPLTEEQIEDVLVDKESVRVSQVHFTSSLKDSDLSFTYEAVTDWGTFNVADLVDKMVLFSAKLNGVPLYEYQLELQKRIFESVLLSDGEELTGLFSRQSGKTETLAQSCNTLLVLIPLLARIFPEQLGRFKRGFRIGLFAPTNEQAYTTHSRMDLRLSDEDADSIMSDSDINAQKKYSNGILQITGADEQLPSGKIIPSFRSFCKVQSAAKQTKIESKTYDLILIDEAQEVDTLKVQKSIHPMVSSCVCAGSIVFDSEGVETKIEDFRDTYVLGSELKMEQKYKGSVSHKVVKDTVQRSGSTGKKQCVELTTNTGRKVSCSVDHPYAHHDRNSRKCSWKGAGQFKVGDSIGVADSIPFFGRKRMFDPRLIGMLIGDGSYRKDGMVRYCSCDSELLNYVKKSYEFKAYASHTTKDGKLFEDGTIKGLCSRLRTLGIYGQVSVNKTLPASFSSYRKKDLAEMIGGLFDTDGCVNISKGRRVQISFSTVSDTLANEIQRLLWKFGVHSTVKQYSPSKGSKGKNPYSVLIIADKKSVVEFSKNFKFLLKYKQETLKKGVAILSAHKSKIKEYSEGIRFERVVSVKKLGLRDVYNFTTCNTHTYLVNGFVSHNTNGTIVKIGTCTTFRSDFYDATIRNKRKYLRSGIRNHFEFDYKTCQRFNKYYKSWVTKEKERIGEDSDAFRMAFRLEWLIEKGMAITPQMYEEYLKVPGNKFEYTPTDGATYVAGLDLGKENDSTVMTIARIEEDPIQRNREDEAQDEKFIKTVVNWIEMIGDNWEVQFETVVSAVRNYGIKVLTVDSTGVGDVIYDRLERVLEDEDVVLIPVIFNLKEKHAMATIFYEELRAMRLRIPAHQSATKTKRHQNFLMQFYACEKVYNKSYMQLKHGEEKDAHDDYVDSLLLLCYGVEQNLSPRIRSTDNFMRHDGGFREDTHRSRRFQKAMAQHKRQNAANWRRYSGK